MGSEKKKKYFKLLKELISVAQQRENETTEEDSFSDLKIDLFEEMKRIGLEIGAELRSMKTKGLQKPKIWIDFWQINLIFKFFISNSMHAYCIEIAIFDFVLLSNLKLNCLPDGHSFDCQILIFGEFWKLCNMFNVSLEIESN